MAYKYHILFSAKNKKTLEALIGHT